MTGILTEVRQERGVEVDDIAEAAAGRIGRQGYLLQRDRQSVFVIEEPVLRFRSCGTEVQRDQLPRQFPRYTGPEGLIRLHQDDGELVLDLPATAEAVVPQQPHPCSGLF